MASTIDSTGLNIETFPEIVADLVASFENIYGPDINVDSNSPDGQLINIVAQGDSDLLQLLQLVYNAMAVPTSFGVRLDQLVVLNGLARKQGTFTIDQVAVTFNTAITLPGLDQTDVPAFTVADNAGNQYQLIASYAAGAPGTFVLAFQAVDIGQVETIPNTITNIITSTLGVTSVNNPSVSISTTGTISISSPTVTSIPSTATMLPGMTITGAGIPNGTTILSVDSSVQITMTANATANTSGLTIAVATAADVIGVNEETDYQLKVRHDQSFNLGTTGPSDAVESALRNIADVVDAYVVENATSSPVNSIPANGIWCIVNGGTNAEIAQAIYTKKGPGSPMKGSVSQVVTRPNGSTFTAKWDVAISQTLYVKFGIIWRGAQALSNADIESALEAALSYKLGQQPSIGDVMIAMNTIAPTAIVTINSSTEGVSSDNASWASQVTPTDAQHYFGTINVVVS